MEIHGFDSFRNPSIVLFPGNLVNQAVYPGPEKGNQVVPHDAGKDSPENVQGIMGACVDSGYSKNDGKDSHDDSKQAAFFKKGTGKSSSKSSVVAGERSVG